MSFQSNNKYLRFVECRINAQKVSCFFDGDERDRRHDLSVRGCRVISYNKKNLIFVKRRKKEEWKEKNRSIHKIALDRK